MTDTILKWVESEPTDMKSPQLSQNDLSQAGEIRARCKHGCWVHAKPLAKQGSNFILSKDKQSFIHEVAAKLSLHNLWKLY